tara:strand:- start:1974 stop:2603 length:630 start_codon:yes stop_codon:yes gene_type:complete
MQYKIFLKKEGDKYFERNKNKIYKKDHLFYEIKNAHRNKKINRLLEIGCGSGERLDLLNKELNIKSYGVEPSKKAVDYIKKKFKKILIKRGTANNFVYKKINFDALVFGFCLYLVDINDYAKVFSETDRVTRKGSVIIIKDFFSDRFRTFPYKHHRKVFVNKYDFSKIFTWSPKFKLKKIKFFDHDDPFKKNIKKNNLVALSVIEKIDD